MKSSSQATSLVSNVVNASEPLPLRFETYHADRVEEAYGESWTAEAAEEEAYYCQPIEQKCFACERIGSGTEAYLRKAGWLLQTRSLCDVCALMPRIGLQFDFWTTTGNARRDSHGTPEWECRCVCGATAWLRRYSLLQERSRSCGCKRERYTPHGGYGTAEYRIFMGMRARCFNANDKHYPNYGGRGITICNGWSDFASFRASMGLRPSDAHSIDRIDNDGNYSCGKCGECRERGWPFNCRWALPDVQANNKRTTRYVTHNGERRTLAEWAEFYGIPKERLVDRLRLGWSFEDAVSSPFNYRRTSKLQTHCKNGHPLSGENLAPTALEKYGQRQCLICMRERAKKQRQSNHVPAR